MEKENLNGLLEEIYNSMTDEQKQKAAKCETEDEFLAFAGEEGIPLPDEILEMTTGGTCIFFGADEITTSSATTRKSIADSFKKSQTTFGQTPYNSKKFNQ